MYPGSLPLIFNGSVPGHEKLFNFAGVQCKQVFNLTGSTLLHYSCTPGTPVFYNVIVNLSLLQEEQMKIDKMQRLSVARCQTPQACVTVIYRKWGEP